MWVTSISIAQTFEESHYLQLTFISDYPFSAIQVRRIDAKFPGEEKAIKAWLVKNDLPVYHGSDRMCTPHPTLTDISANIPVAENNPKNILEQMSSYDVYQTHSRLSRRKWRGTTLWIIGEAKFKTWLENKESSELWLCGKGSPISVTRHLLSANLNT